MNDLELLIDGVISGNATQEQQAELAERLTRDPELRRVYAEQIRLHALLEWRSGRIQDTPQISSLAKTLELPRARPFLFVRRTLALAAGLVAMALLGWLLWPRPPVARSGEIAEILYSNGAILEGNHSPLVIGEHREFRKLSLRAGVLRMRLASGAIIGVHGPAQLEFVDSMHVRVLAGRITADADAAHGFTILTATTSVVDLGTRFGVNATDQGTDVVVFDGAVELQESKQRAGGNQRMERGEALRLSSGGTQEPIFNITDGGQPEEWTDGAVGIFRSVRDNRRPDSGRKFYQVVPQGMREDTRAYVDRDHEWNGLNGSGLPEFLRGADLIRPFNDDKRETDLAITVDLTQPATLYLFLERKPPPAGVERAGFTDTGSKIGLDEGSSPNRVAVTAKGAGNSVERVFSVWKLEVRELRSIQLGSPREGDTGAKAMYGVAAQPLKGSPAR